MSDIFTVPYIIHQFIPIFFPFPSIVVSGHIYCSDIGRLFADLSAVAKSNIVAPLRSA